MSATNGLLSYNFTHYIRASQLADGETILAVTDEHNSGDQWKFDFQPDQISCRVCLTLTRSGGGDCSYNVKLSVSDENGQVKLDLVRKGWNWVGARKAFQIPYEMVRDLTNSQGQIAIVNLAIIKIPKPSKADELSTSFRSESFGDVEIECGDGVKLYCHKGILAAKSSVFAKMFSVAMKESVENRVRIDDFSSDVISVLLRFVYLGDWGDLSSVADGVYKAADRYQLEQLKMAATAELSVNLNADSIVSTLRLARLYKDDMLAERSINYLAYHKSEVSAMEVMAEAFKSQ